MGRFLKKYLLFNANFKKNEFEIKYKFIFLNSAFLVSAFLAIVLGMVQWHHNLIVSLFDFIYAFLGILLLIYLHRHKEKTESIASIALIFAILYSYLNFLFDPEDSTRVILFFLVEAAVVYLKGRKIGAWVMLLLIFSLLLGHFFVDNNSNYTNIDIVSICAYLIIFYIIIDNFGFIREKQNVSLSQMNKRLKKDVEKRTHALLIANEELTSLNTKVLDALNEMKTVEHEEQLINKLNSMLQLCNTAEETYPRIQLIAQDLFQEVSGGLSVYQPSIQQLETVVQWGPEQILLPLFDPADCFGVRSGNVSVVNEYKTAVPCPHYITPPQGGYMGIPMFVMNDLIAVCHLFAPPEQKLSKHIQEVAIAFSNIIKIALTNINLRQYLQEMSLRDALTGLYNRRYLKEFLPRELNRIRHDDGHLVVAILDIDDFKRVNDTFGHEAGDEVLKSIGNILNQTFRASDMACRFGGEEFFVVMLGCSVDEAVKKLERVRERIKNTKVSFQGQDLPETILSAGVSSSPQDGTDYEALIDVADRALYKAKKLGKDRIEIYQSKSS